MGCTVKGISPVLCSLPWFKDQRCLPLCSANSESGAPAANRWSCENSVSQRKPGTVPGRPERSSTSLTVMPCHYIDITQPNSSVPSGTPLALLLVGIWLWAVVEGSVETTQFLRSQWFFWGTQHNWGNTHIPRQRGMLIVPACCRLQLGKWKKGLVSSTTGTLAFVHQQYFKERGWVVQSSRVEVQSHCWRLKKEAFHCTSSLALPMCWGEPSWLSDTVCLGSNSLSN